MAKKRTDGERCSEPGRDYQHRYPTSCPQCEADLKGNNAVLILFSIAGTEVAKNSYLEDDGLLVDIDHLIQNGYHSDTLCAKCTHSLAEHELL